MLDVHLENHVHGLRHLAQFILPGDLPPQLPAEPNRLGGQLAIPRCQLFDDGHSESALVELLADVVTGHNTL